MKSNIDITSNIYIRTPDSLISGIDDLSKDPNYVRQITGKAALDKVKQRYGGSLSTVRLSKEQEEECSQGTQCGYCKDGQIPYGKVRTEDGYKYTCRCECYDCKNVNKCNPPFIQRDISKEIIVEDLNTITLTWLGIDDLDSITEWDRTSPAQEEAAFEDERDSSIQSKEPADELPASTKDSPLPINEIKYEEIDADQAVNAIIKSPLASHIIVNAAPGTGKTYTAIERLKYVISQTEPEDICTILMLCYTRAAVQEIKDRIRLGIANGDVPQEAIQAEICTFDSFASSYLLTKEMTPEQLSSMNYDERIQCFNRIIFPEDFDVFSYCIIDELQDLVNDRAMMTVNLLNALQCGYLLLGDKCQAIYDYESRGAESIRSVQFYQKLDNILPEDTQRYEIIGGHRQSEVLEKKTNLLRRALLNTSSLTEVYNVFDQNYSDLKRVFSAEAFAKEFTPHKDRKTAILCRNNGEAAYMSHLLLKNGKPHKLIRNASHDASIHRMIADILWDYNEAIISRDDFIQRAIIRCNYKESGKMFDDIDEFVSDTRQGFFDKELFARKLINKETDIPQSVLAPENNNLIVSTIHKAKGREFDQVYLINGDYQHSEFDTEEERVLYVAETRAKSSVQLLDKKTKQWYFKKSIANRWIRTVRKEYKAYAKAFAFGADDDLAYEMFAAGNLEGAILKQEYISRNVHKGDQLSLVLDVDNNTYRIMHRDMIIGNTSPSFIAALTDCYGNDKRQYIYGLPKLISDLYVTDIITFVSYRDYECIPPLYRQNRFWLAVKISGFGQLDWK